MATYICECGEVYESTIPYAELHCLVCGKIIKREQAEGGD